MSEIDRHRFSLRRTLLAASFVGLLLTCLGTWPFLYKVLPDRLEEVARVCAMLALPGILTALIVGQNTHDYSRGVVFVSNLLFYSVVIAVLLTLKSLWSRHRRAS